jgi:NTP pyrophosphatase (non-canonical NTP hydrolase)
MDFNKYQLYARSSAVYPFIGHNLAYAALGLNEECGEVLEKSIKGDTEGVLKELSDVMWYTATCAFEVAAELNFVAQKRVLLLDKKPRELIVDMMYQASIISGRSKKILRDNHGVVPEDKREVVIKALAQILSLVDLIAQHHGSSIQEVMEINVAKLKQRIFNQTLKGDGDDR